MTVHQSNPDPDVVPVADSLNLGAVQIVDIISGVVHELDKLGQRVHIVMERAPTVIADSAKLAEVMTSLLRSALESAPAGGPIEVEVAAGCLAQSHEPVASGGDSRACTALVSVAIRDHGLDAEPQTQTPTPNRKGSDVETSLKSAQNVMRLHRGKLWVTNRSKHGRTLGFCLNSEQAA